MSTRSIGRSRVVDGSSNADSIQVERLNRQKKIMLIGLEIIGIIGFVLAIIGAQSISLHHGVKFLSLLPSVMKALLQITEAQAAIMLGVGASAMLISGIASIVISKRCCLSSSHK